MDDVKFVKVVDPVTVMVDSSYKKVLDEAIAAIKDNPGKWAELSIDCLSKDEKVKRAKKLRVVVAKMAKYDQKYKNISIAIEESDSGEIGVYVKEKQKEIKKISQKKSEKSDLTQANKTVSKPA